MAIRARILPKYPVRLQGDGSITIEKENGIVTIGFDYLNSEFGGDLMDAIAAAQAAADAAAISADEAAASALAAAISAAEAAASALAAALSAAGLAKYNSLAAALAAVPLSAPYFETEFYATLGDKGGARYIAIAAPSPAVAGPGQYQAASTDWFQISMTVLTPQMFGAKADAVVTGDADIASPDAGFGVVSGTDDSDALENWWRTMQIQGSPGLWEGDYRLQEGRLDWTNISGSPAYMLGGTFIGGAYTGGRIHFTTDYTDSTPAAEPDRLMFAYSVGAIVENNATIDQAIEQLNDHVADYQFKFEKEDGKILAKHTSGNLHFGLSGNTTLMTTLGFPPDRAVLQGQFGIFTIGVTPTAIGQFGDYAAGTLTVTAGAAPPVNINLGPGVYATGDWQKNQVLEAITAGLGNNLGDWSVTQGVDGTGFAIRLTYKDNSIITVSGATDMLNKIGFKPDNLTSTEGDYCSFDHGGVLGVLGEHEPGPNITTGALTIYPMNTSNEPVIRIGSKQSYRYIIGGSVGNITFKNMKTGLNSALPAPPDTLGAHCISTSGIQGIKFGYIYGEYTRGDVVHFETRFNLAADSDAYHVLTLDFAAIDNYRGRGWALYNGVGGQGCSGCHFALLRSIGFQSTSPTAGVPRTLGAWYGPGAACSCDFVSCGYTFGYAIDWSTTDEFAGGSHKSTVLTAEIDGTEYGIRVNNMRTCRFLGIRFVHRSSLLSGFTINGVPSYPVGESWPKKCITLGNELISTGFFKDSYVNDLLLECQHRIDVAADPDDVAAHNIELTNTLPFVDMSNNGGLTHITIRQRIIGGANPPLPLDDDSFVGNVNYLCQGNLFSAIYSKQHVANVNTSMSEIVHDSRIPSHYAKAQMETGVSASIPNTHVDWGQTNFDTDAMPFTQYSREIPDLPAGDKSAAYNPTSTPTAVGITDTFKYTVPYTGWYHIKASITLDLPAGTRVRMAVVRIRKQEITPSTTPKTWYNAQTIIAETWAYAATANEQTYTVEYLGPLRRFFEDDPSLNAYITDYVGICIDQNSGGAVDPVAAPFNQAAHNFVSYRPITYSAGWS